MIKHIRRDGREMSTISGVIVKKDDCPVIYALLDRIKSEGRRKNG